MINFPDFIDMIKDPERYLEDSGLPKDIVEHDRRYWGDSRNKG